MEERGKVAASDSGKAGRDESVGRGGGRAAKGGAAVGGKKDEKERETAGGSGLEEGINMLLVVVKLGRDGSDSSRRCVCSCNLSSSSSTSRTASSSAGANI